MYLNKALDYSAFGFELVVHAVNGKEALEQMAQHLPDVMLLDIEMPIMNGLQLLEHMQELGIKTHVIILSAYDDFPYVQQCLRFGVSDYILKPINLAELSERLRDVISSIEESIKQEMTKMLAFCCTKPKQFIPPNRQDGIGVLCVREGEGEGEAYSMPIAAEYNCAGKHFILFFPDNEAVWNLMLQNLQEHAGSPIGASWYESSIALLPQAIDDAQKALLRSFYSPGFYTNDSHYFVQGTPSDYEEYTTALIYQLGHGSENEQATIAIQRLIARFAKDRLAPECAINVCRAFLFRIIPNGNTELLDAINCFSSDQLCDMVLQAIGFLIQEDSDAQLIMDQVKEYVERHHAENLTLEMVAAQFFMSKFQLSRMFKRQYGVTYQDYIIQVRMHDAEVLLETTSMKVYEISKKVGFEDAGYFSSAFKHYHGVNPREYRAQKNIGR